MKKYINLILAVFIFSCSTNETQNNADADVVIESDTTGKFGEWEQDNEGNKYREDHKLRDFLAGHEVLKYTHTDSTQSLDNSSKTKFIFCLDGTLKYYHRSLTSVTGEEAGGKDASAEEDQGTWKAIENTDGVKLILLRSNKDSKTRYMEVKVVGGTNLRLLWDHEWHEFLIKKIDC